MSLRWEEQRQGSLGGLRTSGETWEETRLKWGPGELWGGWWPREVLQTGHTGWNEASISVGLRGLHLSFATEAPAGTASAIHTSLTITG